MRGRKPVPIEQHKARGTYRADRHKGIAANDHGIPECPTWLSGRARDGWIEIAPMLDARGVLTQADAVSLQALCERYADWRELREEVRAEGRTYSTTNPAGDEMIRPNPKAAMLDEAERALKGWLIEFGLTPAARSKVAAIGEKKNENPFAQFRGSA